MECGGLNPEPSLCYRCGVWGIEPRTFSVLQLWNVADGSLARVCSREGKDPMDSLHGGWACDLHFSPDDALLVSVGGYIKVRPGGAHTHGKHTHNAHDAWLCMGWVQWLFRRRDVSLSGVGPSEAVPTVEGLLGGILLEW